MPVSCSDKRVWL